MDKRDELGKGPDRLSTKNTGLNATFVESTHSRAKSSKQVIYSRPNDHTQNALEMEKIIRQYRGKGKLEIFSALFDEVIRIDPYYGSILKEIKKEYDTIKDYNPKKCKELEQEISALKESNARLQNEMKSHNSYIDRSPFDIVKSLKEKYGMLNETSEKKENTIENLKNNTVEIDKSELENLHNEVKSKGKVGGRNKSVIVPRLDLSKIRNQYANDKVIIAQPKKRLSGVLIENTGINNLQSHNYKNWKELNEYCIDLCNKSNTYSEDLLAKYKKDI